MTRSGQVWVRIVDCLYVYKQLIKLILQVECVTKQPGKFEEEAKLVCLLGIGCSMVMYSQKIDDKC